MNLPFGMEKNPAQYCFLFLLLFILSCSNDKSDSTEPSEIIGTWELSRIENSDMEETQLFPNDGKPVRINFMQAGTYEGVAGNNVIFGDYRIESDSLMMTLTTTEVSNTEWEQLFKDALRQTQSEDRFMLPMTIATSELALRFGENGQLIFIRI